MLEGAYKTKLIKDIDRLLPGCIVLKNDAGYMQGIPDLSVFYGPRYGFLEVKTSEDASLQPNQDYYVDLFAGWAFGAFIYPENEREVLRDLQQALSPGRTARISQPKPVSLDSVRRRKAA